MKKTIFQCPNCSKALMQGQRQYFCSGGHCFDISKKGYVNLLLQSHIGAGTPGDSKDMIQSRREFLNKGYYERFSDKLNDMVASLLQNNKTASESINIFDAGCGEGYYISRLKNQLASLTNYSNINYYGSDVSKDAIHYAAGRDKDIRFAVASNYHLPIQDGSVDCILCIFAPRDEQEFRRIIKPSGKLLVAAPSSIHLFSFRKLLYENPEVLGVKGTVGEGFDLVEQSNVKYDIHLKNKQDIMNLFKMTPYSRHADIETLESLNEFVTEVDINIRAYQPT